MSGSKTRLDKLLVEQGYFADVDSAARAIYAGEITSPKLSALKPGTLVSSNEELSVKGQKPYVSRGGYKLAFALDSFTIDASGLRCIDIGAGSGGFTDCLLQRGARLVTAVDVGYGQFDWRTRQDTRVTLLERTNFRRLAAPSPSEAFDLAVVDLSFTRTSLLLGTIRSFIKADGQVIILIKPQFELTDKQVASTGFQSGVVVDSMLHQEVLEQFLDRATAAKLHVQGLIPSPIKGADGNSEFLFWATISGFPVNIDIQKVVSQI